jgi:hypothetical protein
MDLKDDAMFAAYAALQNGQVQTAKECLIVGLEGGSVNNPLDFQRCWDRWKERVRRRKAGNEKNHHFKICN